MRSRYITDGHSLNESFLAEKKLSSSLNALLMQVY